MNLKPVLRIDPGFANTWAADTGVGRSLGGFVMVRAPRHLTPRQAPSHRRGALLLLVLSMLTLFLMIGTLMLVLATRARTTARAFADVIADGGLANLTARDLLDEALMVFLRGRQPAGGGGAPRESILEDRYGNTTLQGQVTGLGGAGGPVLQATVTGINAPDLRGRILTIRPQTGDPAPIQSFRILSVNGQTFELANLRTVEAFRTLPGRFPCEVFVNGREFDGEPPGSLDEPWDATDGANPWLLPALPVPPPNPADLVDNDGDGLPDGSWVPDILPPQRAGRSARVSFLVRELDGCLNVNAHGSPNAPAGIGPASVDGSKVLTDPNAWTAILSGTTSPANPPAPTANQRRAPPALGGTVQGRFGGLPPNPPIDPYALRLDFDGPRRLAGAVPIGSVFTLGELERVLRPFDLDAGTLSPRLAAILGTAAQPDRSLVTSDSWDTCGITGSAATHLATADPTPLAAEVKEGLKFDLNRPWPDDPAKQTYFKELLATIVAAGAPAARAAQWAANVVEFRDTDTNPGTYTPPAGTPVTGVEPPADGTYGTWNSGRFESVGELLGVHAEKQPDFDNAKSNNLPLRSLAAEHPRLLEATGVPSRFASTVATPAGGRTLNRWREPGRVNVNTCDQKVWQAAVGPGPNPFRVAPAKSTGDILLTMPGVFAGPGQDTKTLNRPLANRLATIATCRSHVFAVWITLELVDPDIRGGSPSLQRLFAIVDRSVPAGFALGQDLNARDTVRLLRYLE